MDQKFCPRCGRNGDLYKGFCPKCFGEMARLVDFPAFIEFRKCRKCGNLYLKGEWVPDAPELFNQLASSQVRSKLHDPHFDVKRGRDYAHVSVRGHADSEKLIEVKDEARLHLRVDESLCDACSRTSAQKYEVRIQVRKKEEPDEALFSEVIKFIKQAVAITAEKTPRAASFWQEDTKEGPDFLFGYRDTGERIAKALHSRFRLRVQESSKQFGFDKSGKPRLRMTFCARV